MIRCSTPRSTVPPPFGPSRSERPADAISDGGVTAAPAQARTVVRGGARQAGPGGGGGANADVVERELRLDLLRGVHDRARDRRLHALVRARADVRRAVRAAEPVRLRRADRKKIV